MYLALKVSTILTLQYPLRSAVWL